jgi:hypothetical protein
MLEEHFDPKIKIFDGQFFFHFILSGQFTHQLSVNMVQKIDFFAKSCDFIQQV